MAIILVFEHNIDLQVNLINLIKEGCLNSMVHIVSESHNGIKLAIEKEPDIVILGTLITNAERFEVCRQLKNGEQTEHIPILFLINKQDSKEIRQQAIESGAEVFLSLPADEIELSALITAMVKIKRLSGEKVFVYDNSQKLHAKRELEEGEREQAEMKNTFGISIFAKDITQRKQVEKIIAEKEKEYQNLVENISVGIVVHDSNSAVVLSNPAANQILGLSDDQMRGKVAMDPYWHFCKEDRSPLPIAEYPVNLILSTGEVISNYMLGLIRSDLEKPVWGICNGYPVFDTYGKVKQAVITFADITKHKQAEESLRIREHQFFDIFNNLHDGYVKAELSGKLTSVSPSAVRMFGYESVKDMMEITASQLFVNSSERDSMIEKLAVNGYLLDHIYQARKKNGTTFWVSLNIHHHYDEQGQYVGNVGVLRDITDRMKAEKEILQIKERFQTMFEQAPFGMMLSKSINNELIEINDKFAEIVGRTKEELMTIDWMPLTHPDDLQKDIHQLTKMNAGEIPGYQIKKRFIRPDRSVVWVNMTIVKINNDDLWHPQNLCMLEDITDHINSEQQIKTLSAVVEQSPLMIIITDKKGKVNFVNKKFTSFMQYNPLEILGKEPWIFKKKNHTSASFHTMWETLNSGQVWQTEFQNRKKDFTPFVENVTIFPLLYNNGEISNYIIIKEDITEKKQLLNDLIAAKDRAEESDQLKSSFLANISHEIRTPLNSIIGFSDLLLDPFFEEQKSEFINLIKNSGNNLLAIINDIMDISKIESGQITILKENFSLAKLINEVALEQSLAAQKKGLEIRVSLPKQDICIESDKGRIKQIILNFVNNSIKFTEKGYIEIGVHVFPEHIRIHVKDTGIGIAAEYHEKIFQRFRQVESALSRKFGGNGLGLAISKQLAVLMGGDVGVESEPGKGSTFFVIFNRFSERLN